MFTESEVIISEIPNYVNHSEINNELIRIFLIT